MSQSCADLPLPFQYRRASGSVVETRVVFNLLFLRKSSGAPLPFRRALSRKALYPCRCLDESAVDTEVPG